MRKIRTVAVDETREKDIDRRGFRRRIAGVEPAPDSPRMIKVYRRIGERLLGTRRSWLAVGDGDLRQAP